MPRAPAPRIARIEQRDTHRLIASQYSEDGQSVLVRISDDIDHLREIFDLDRATNDRLTGEHDLFPEIGLHELVSGFPSYRIVNAAFTLAHPLGSRFNAPDRGAWYARFELETSQREIAWHKTVELAEIGWFEDSVACDDYIADFTANFPDLRGAKSFGLCLSPDSYEASQDLAARLLAAGSLGIVYPSVRRRGGTCLACFRPALVNNVRKYARYRFTWSGSDLPGVEFARRF